MSTLATIPIALAALVFGPLAVIMAAWMLLLLRLTVRTALVVIRTEVGIWRWRRAQGARAAAPPFALLPAPVAIAHSNGRGVSSWATNLSAGIGQ